MIAYNALDFIKNILSAPSSNPRHNEVTTITWQLMFNLIRENRENQGTIWSECSELFMNYLQQNIYDNDTCCLVVFHIYALGGLGKSEGTRMLKSLLKSFHRKRHTAPLGEQGLTQFLAHLITDEEDIGIMYKTLSGAEKMALLQYIIDHTSTKSLDGLKDVPVSQDLLFSMFNDFNSKSDLFFNSLSEGSHFHELIALLEAIAHVTDENHHVINIFVFELLANFGKLVNFITLNDEIAERAFSSITRNAESSLKEMIMSTISKLMKISPDYKDVVNKF